MFDFEKLIEEQEEERNTNWRYNKDELMKTIKYCSTVARLLLEQVLNKNYYPLAHDDDIEYIMNGNIVECVLNVLYPYFINSSFIIAKQKQIQKDIEEYELEHYLLYLRDDNSAYQQMLEYLKYTFRNIL